MTIGTEICTELRTQKIDGKDYRVLEMTGCLSGGSLHAKWELDANRFQVAAAIERLAAALRHIEIQS